MNRREFLAVTGAAGVAPLASTSASAGSQPVSPPPRTGAADRELWISAARRLADPVLTHLAAGTLKATMPVDEYVDLVVSGELHDSTLTFQLDNGFQVRGLLENYLEDEADDGWAALIVWDNPGYVG